MMSDEMISEPQNQTRIPMIWILAIVVLGILVLGDLNRRMTDARRLEQDTLILQTEVSAMATERVDLMTRVAEATSEKVVAAWAREDAKLVRPGEVLVVPVGPPGATPMPGQQPGGSNEELSNLEIWLELLFGG